MLKNLLDACGGAIGFYTIGYAFAYGDQDPGNEFIGTSNFFLRNEDGSGYSYMSFFFQFAFAATAATIVAGTVAERCKMAAYLCYSVFLTGFVSRNAFTQIMVVIVSMLIRENVH
jgi:Amt family ammonium transporter